MSACVSFNDPKPVDSDREETPLPPEITFSATQPTDVLNSNAASFPLSGACEPGEGDVTVSYGSGTSTVTCQAAGIWSATLDLSAQPDGTLTVTVSQGTGTSSFDLTVDAALCRANAGNPDATNVGGELHVCSPTQFWNLILDGSTQKIVLRDDLDFGGITVNSPLGPLTGSDSFNGNGRTMLNFEISAAGRVAVFDGIGGVGADSVTVENVVFDSVTLTAAAVGPVGVLGGEVSTDHASDSITIRGITVRNSTINAAGTGFTAAGAILGTVYHGGGAIQIEDLAVEDATVNGDERQIVGGVIGEVFGDLGTISVSNVTIRNLSVGGIGSVGGLTGRSKAGIISGVTATDVSIDVSMNPGTAIYAFGGLVGTMFQGSELTDASVTGTIHLSYGNVQEVGGMVGLLQDTSQISRGFADVSIDVPADASGSIGAGGFVGRMNNTSAVRQSAALGDVIADRGVGGFVGDTIWGSEPVIEDCYSRGSVTAREEDAGGFIGVPGAYLGPTATIARSYTTSPVQITGTGTHIDAFGDPGMGIFTNVYFNSTTASPETSSIATALTDTQMRSLSNFTGFSTSVWENGTLYPQLLWQD